MTSFRVRSTLVLMLLVTTACGGGGGGDSGPIKITFGTGPLTARFAQGDQSPMLRVSATLSRLPDHYVYVRIEEDAEVLTTTELDISQQGKTFETSVRPICMLSPGVHSGNLTLKLCDDAECTAPLELSGNVLPYAFTVDPGMVVTAKVGGVAQPGSGAVCHLLQLTVGAGQEVELTSAVPVSWSHTTGSSWSMPSVTGLTKTDTTWTGTVTADIGGLPSGGLLGSVTVVPSPVGGPANDFPIVSISVISP